MPFLTNISEKAPRSTRPSHTATRAGDQFSTSCTDAVLLGVSMGRLGHRPKPSLCCGDGGCGARSTAGGKGEGVCRGEGLNVME